MPDPKDNDKTTTPTDKNTATEPAEATTLLTSEATVAKLADLKSALPDAGAEFYVKCLEKDLTVAQAKDSWMERLTATNQAQAKEIELNKAKQEAPGVDPLNHDAPDDGTNGAGAGTGAGDAQARWNEVISDKVKSGMTRSQAAAAVNREDPQLREDMVTEKNIAQGRARAVA